MRRFFVPQITLTQACADLPRDVAHHIGSVLRLRQGDRIVLCDGRGDCAECRIDEVSPKRCRVTCLRQWTEQETALPVSLIQGLPHSDKLDLILQKTTELGVRRVLPVRCQRCQYPIAPAKAMRKLERWQKIAAEAARQSERSWLPEVAALCSFDEAVRHCDADLKLVLWEQADQPLHHVLPEKVPDHVAVVVGPEGGLTEEEVALATQHGFVAVGLGPRILRTETAGMALMAILQYQYGDLNRIPREQIVAE
nr:16S rRNA (uracil(1498)-N(3))-methyltransferase [uncultured Desulfuromonas sp.]